MKLIWNPWKKIKELECKADDLAIDAFSAYAEAQQLVDVLNEIALVAGPRSSAIVRRMSEMAQDAVDKFYGFELDEE